MLSSSIHTKYMLKDLLEEGELSELSINNVTVTETVCNKLIPIKNLMYDYIDIIKNGSVLVELSDDEMDMYRYSPKKLSYALYGTVEMYFILLMLNGMYSITQFNKKKIWVFDKRNNHILDKIYQNIREYKNKRDIPN